MNSIAETGLISVEDHILRTLSYFDIFSYPLTVGELRVFLGCIIEEDELTLEINDLLGKGVIYKTNGFYSIQNDETLGLRRQNGNAEADRLFPLAVEKAKFIFSFPFIRAIMISGSLSKGYMDEKSDLDFFIITEPKRLWIARTIFDFYRKLFIAKKDWKHYCLNYFISFDHLLIEEQNIFTATELATLKPLTGAIHYENLLKENSWIRGYFPNFRLTSAINRIEKTEVSLKARLEKIINFTAADQIDPFVKWVRFSWFRIKFEKKFSKSDFKVAFKSKSYVSKVHSTNGQSKILSAYSSNLKRMDLPEYLYHE